MILLPTIINHDYFKQAFISSVFQFEIRYNQIVVMKILILTKKLDEKLSNKKTFIMKVCIGNLIIPT